MTLTTTVPGTTGVSLCSGSETYRELDNAELEQRILAVKRQSWARVCSLILGHHYQQDEVIRFADLRRGQLPAQPPQLAAQSQACRAIVFYTACTSWP